MKIFPSSKVTRIHTVGASRARWIIAEKRYLQENVSSVNSVLVMASVQEPWLKTWQHDSTNIHISHLSLCTDQTNDLTLAFILASKWLNYFPQMLHYFFEDEQKEKNHTAKLLFSVFPAFLFFKIRLLILT